MLVNSLKHVNNEQNKTMMVHYVKVEFYLLFVKLRHYEEWNDEVIQYRIIILNNRFFATLRMTKIVSYWGFSRSIY